MKIQIIVMITTSIFITSYISGQIGFHINPHYTNLADSNTKSSRNIITNDYNMLHIYSDSELHRPITLVNKKRDPEYPLKGALIGLVSGFAISVLYLYESRSPSLGDFFENIKIAAVIPIVTTAIGCLIGIREKSKWSKFEAYYGS